MNVSSLIELKANPKIPELAPGDTVKVSIKVIEGGKERIQLFQGVVIKIQSGGINASFTVRRIAYGVGVERTFPLYSPRVEKVEIVRHGKVRRARLYYLRGRSGKAARIKERRVDPEKIRARAQEELAQAEPEAARVQEEEPELAQTQEELVQGEIEAAPAQEEVARDEPETVKAQEEPGQVEEEVTPTKDELPPDESEKVEAQAESEVTQPQAELTRDKPEAAEAQEEPEATRNQEEEKPAE